MTLFTLFNPVKSHSMTGGFQTSIQILQHSSLGWICSNFSFMFNCWFSTCKIGKTLGFSSSLFVSFFMYYHIKSICKYVYLGKSSVRTTKFIRNWISSREDHLVWIHRYQQPHLSNMVEHKDSLVLWHMPFPLKEDVTYYLGSFKN